MFTFVIMCTSAAAICIRIIWIYFNSLVKILYSTIVFAFIDISNSAVMMCRCFSFIIGVRVIDNLRAYFDDLIVSLICDCGVECSD